MRLVHYSAAPVTVVRTVTQRPSCVFKPRGLWLSIEGTGRDDGWRNLCISGEFSLSRLTHVYDVTLDPGANVLWLRDGQDVHNFQAAYGKQPDIYGPNDGINWLSVADQYEGLIITPYSRTWHEADWFNEWACSGGCIWDRQAITSITLREIVPLAEIEALAGIA